MNNWEKLLCNEVYDDFATELTKRRVEAKKLFNQYNKLDDSNLEKRENIVKELFGSIGNKVYIEPNFRCEYGKNIFIGNNVYINFECIILDCAKITIGNDVLFGPRVGIYAANHGLDPIERMNGACSGKDVIIEDKVWIGGDVKILGGVTIGEGSVIGTGSVVTRDIPRGVIAVGNPCRVLRKITEEDQLKFDKEE